MKVSILVPVYGVERFIERCARSLLEQTYTDLEYIFVDDCTPDRSIDILHNVIEEYPGRKEAVHIIRHEHNRGLSAARNTALDSATGEFVFHVDSDDYIDRDAIRLLIAKQMESDADIVTGNTLVIYPDKTVASPDPDYSDSHSMTSAMMLAHHYIWNRLIRLSLYNNNGLRLIEGVNVSEGYQQTPILAYYAHRVARIDDITYFYCKDNQSSYVHLYNKNFGLMQESLESFMIVERFFADKEIVFRDISRRRSAQRVRSLLIKTAKLNDREHFRQIRDLAIHQYADFFGATAWKRKFYQLASSNICIYKNYLRLSRFYQRCRSVVRG